MQLRKRKWQYRTDEEDDDRDYIVEHHVMSITSYLDSTQYHTTALNKHNVGCATKMRQSTLEQNAEHGTAVRCKVCPKPAPNTDFCCAQCSDEQEGKMFGVCGPKSGRICGPLHQKKKVD